MAALLKFCLKMITHSSPFSFSLKGFASPRKNLNLNIYRCNKTCGKTNLHSPKEITKHWFEEHRFDCSEDACREKKNKERCKHTCMFCENCRRQEVVGCMTFDPCPREFRITEEDFDEVLKRLHAKDKAEYYKMTKPSITRWPKNREPAGNGSLI